MSTNPDAFANMPPPQPISAPLVDNSFKNFMQWAQEKGDAVINFLDEKLSFISDSIKGMGKKSVGEMLPLADKGSGSGMDFQGPSKPSLAKMDSPKIEQQRVPERQQTVAKDIPMNECGTFCPPPTPSLNFAGIGQGVRSI